MNVVTQKLKERFCKDMQLSIKIFEEPYFSERLALYDKHFDCMESYENFKAMLQSFANEQEYFEAYNNLKDTVINYISQKPQFQYFSKQEDMAKFAVPNLGFSKNSIYKQTFVGKHFVSFDLCKGNFTALKHYCPEIFDNKKTYEEFLGQFTDNKHFLKSKYIRQVIFGSLNPKRQVKYEEYLMSQVLEHILQKFSKEKIVYFSTDEIVIELDGEIDDSSSEIEFIKSTVEIFVKKGISIRGEVFLMDYFPEYDAYIKKVYYKYFELHEKNMSNSEFRVIKNATHLSMPYVLRKLYNLQPDENDKFFIYEGKLAKFVD